MFLPFALLFLALSGNAAYAAPAYRFFLLDQGDLHYGGAPDLNNSGQIVGYGLQPGTGDALPLTWVDRTLAPLDLADGQNGMAAGIHDAGWIVGQARSAPQQLANGAYGYFFQPFLLMPVPEAGAWALLVTGLAPVGLRAQRRPRPANAAVG